MEHAAPIDQTALTAEENCTPAVAAAADDLFWAVVKMRAGERIVINEALSSSA